MAQQFRYGPGSEVLIPIADYLIAQGHGTRREWDTSGHDLPQFIERSMNNLICATGYDEDARYNAPNLNAELNDHDGFYTRGYELEQSKLRIGISSEECGYFRMGPITRKLERKAKGLGAAFYAAVVDSLEEVGWIFDYSRAKYDLDSHREMVEDENGKTWAEMTKEERSQYEMADPDDQMPKHLLPVKSGGFTAERRDLMKQHTRIKAVRMALEMAELAAALHPYGKEYPEGDAPCSYLVFIEQNDAITTWFDEWSQHFLEGEVTHLWARTFNPAKPKEMKRAFEAFTLATRLLSTAAQLTPLVNGAK